MGQPAVHFEVVGRDADEVMEGLVIGMFNDPEGHTIGLIRSGGS